MARITRSTGAGKPDEDKPTKKPVVKKAKKAKKVKVAPTPLRPLHDRFGRPLPPR